MRLVIQRVCSSSVWIDQQQVASINQGLNVLVGVEDSDTDQDIVYAVKKICKLRIFEDELGKMNRSVMDVGGEVLLISQFTLYGDTRKGHRPSFVRAGHPEGARKIYGQLIDAVRQEGISVKQGQFGADMKVDIVNDGPVTLWIDTAEVVRRTNDC